MDSQLPGLLRCPETFQTLHPADDGVLSLVNARIREGKLPTRAGTEVRETVEGGLLREDGAFLYPIRRGIPSLLVDEALPMKSA